MEVARHVSQKAPCACKEPKEPAVRGFDRGMYPDSVLWSSLFVRKTIHGKSAV